MEIINYNDAKSKEEGIIKEIKFLESNIKKYNEDIKIYLEKLDLIKKRDDISNDIDVLSKE